MTPGRRQIWIQTSQLLVLSVLHPLAPLVAPSIARDPKMAPKNNKSIVEDEEVANLSMGWRKSKMSEAAVQELETMGLLQNQVVIQCESDLGP